ncbi:alkaline phosphatase family protein [Flaviaesturariibacter flavus]|uniref:Alkaline phosphatase family protein n=1 Tax=Flaviaesturariibacter flavus TaxID=2502780 RepID=A0A4R1B3C1_9BACT|nr:alkaline phosphatase PafA [Flaviaesturariibacter flavus]TCJ12544.1 alkaline phosphatase family protein [Flaviaesturariibacter flavus]
MKRWLTALFFLLSLTPSFAQAPERPALVVGLVVDQMRWDYLYRYADRYGNDGFRRLLREGFSCENTFIPYTPTYTAPGHTCVYTGSVPSLHGIISNTWWDRSVDTTMYCTEDKTVRGVGTNTVWGQMSPKNLWANTITDELRLATNFRNKTIAIALKDRGAILPGGHTANQAYWFDNSARGWITSTYYGSSMPAWVMKFNARALPDAYLKNNWNTLYPVSTYSQSSADAQRWEGVQPGGGNTFPHIMDTLKGNVSMDAFRTSPWGNTYTLEFAKAAVSAEQLGKGAFTDFLTVSLSSTDYIGHAFGPNSIEAEDCFLRLDREIASFLKFLDASVGKGKYLLFLTADHGAAHSPGFAEAHKLPAGRVDDRALMDSLNQATGRAFGLRRPIKSLINYQVYLDNDAIRKAGADRAAIKNFIMSELMRQPGMSKAVDLENLTTATLPPRIADMVMNGYNQKRSGDIQFMFKPGWFDWGGNTGTTHGAPYPYDAHIPLVFFGWKQQPGRLVREVYMTDIAATIAALLHIQMPNACVGKPIEEVVR